MLVKSLLEYPDCTAAVVDTTGNFDVLRLYALVVSQLQRSLDALNSARTSTRSDANATVEDVAAKVLDHVKIMRVFDFVGVREAIGEIRDDLEGRKIASRQTEEKRDQPARKERPPTPKAPTPEPLTPEPQPVPKRTVVADSEDEDDDEEMLFDTPRPAPIPAPIVEPPIPSQPPEAVNTQHDELPDPPEYTNPKFILIDNLAQVLNPLLKKDYILANDLASTFLQSLNHLTRTHKLYTILANPATHPRAKSPSRPGLGDQAVPPLEHTKQIPIPPPSVFASSTVVPMLGSILPRYTDMGLLVTHMPRKKMDAKAFYKDGAEAGRSVEKMRGVEMVGVLEVVSDRYEGRVGAWGVFAGEAKDEMKDLS